MRVRVQKYLTDNEIPDYLKECLNKLSLEQDKHLIDFFDDVYKLDDYFKRVFFNLNKLHIECDYFKAWAVMRAYYGFEVEYGGGLFKIGGYETERLSSSTLLGLIRKLEKRCK